MLVSFNGALRRGEVVSPATFETMLAGGVRTRGNPAYYGYGFYVFAPGDDRAQAIWLVSGLSLLGCDGPGNRAHYRSTGKLGRRRGRRGNCLCHPLDGTARGQTGLIGLSVGVPAPADP